MTVSQQKSTGGKGKNSFKDKTIYHYPQVKEVKVVKVAK